MMLAASPTANATVTSDPVGALTNKAKEGIEAGRGIVEAPVKATITILTKLYNDNMVRQIVQVIVVDIILVAIFYLITFFFFNKDTRMGEEEGGDSPAHGISKT